MSALISYKNWIRILFVSLILSLGFHSYLSSQHYQLKLGLSTGSVCNISATFNCDAVAASKYSTVFNIPVALFGVMAHLAFLVLLFSAQFNLSENSKPIRRLLLSYSGLIALVSIFMASISTFKLGTFCLFCMATYLLSFLQLIATWKIQTENPLESLRHDLGLVFSQARWVLVILALVPGAAWLSHQIIMDNYGLSKLEAMYTEEALLWQESPVQNFTEQGLVTSAGDLSQTKVTIVEFADFLCPHCKVASTSLEAFSQGNKDIKFIFKTFPLDGKCNKAIDHQGDGVRCQLAAAAVCAENMNKTGWKAHHWIFENQEQLYTGLDPQKALQNIAQITDNNADDFKKCTESDATYEAVQAMAAEGAAAKIQGTPTIFMNGKKVQRGQVLPVLQHLYQMITGN